MLIPIRCFTCGKVLADKWELYEKLCNKQDKQENEVTATVDDNNGFEGNRGKILDDLGIKRICCRRVMLSTVDLTSTI